MILVGNSKTSERLGVLEKEGDEEPADIGGDIAVLLLSFLVKRVFSGLNGI